MKGPLLTELVSRSGAGGPHLGGKCNVLIWMVSGENKEGAPLLAIFEKWGAGPLAAEWLVDEVLRCSRGDGAHLAEVMRNIQVFAAEKPHFSKSARSGASYQRFARHF